MEKYILKTNVKGTELVLWEIPEKEIRKEWNKNFDIIKSNFLKNIQEDNPEVIKIAFETILIEFLKKEKLDEIVIRTENNDNYKYSFDLWCNIKSTDIFTTKKKETIDINTAVMSFINSNSQNEDMMILLSVFVFSWMNNDEITENMGLWLDIAYKNLVKILDISVEK